jgi:hypothetical protein
MCLTMMLWTKCDDIVNCDTSGIAEGYYMMCFNIKPSVRSGKSSDATMLTFSFCSL